MKYEDYMKMWSSGLHEAKTDGIGKLVKDYSPKYPLLEIIISDSECSYIYKMEKCNKKKALKKYGDYKILSIMDFNDTKSTSLILKRKVKLS